MKFRIVEIADIKSVSIQMQNPTSLFEKWGFLYLLKIFMKHSDYSPSIPGKMS